MTIKMIASKRFRLPQEVGFVWLDQNQIYEVATDATADYHENSGRGVRVPADIPAKSGKKGN